MLDSIPALWPPDIHVDVASPLAILRAQAEPLKKATRGYLTADVSSQYDPGTLEFVHTMDLVAIPLNNYRYSLLIVSHPRDQVYPATVSDFCLPGASREQMLELEEIVETRRVAGDDHEFIKIVRDILNSRDVRAVISSMLARINEQSQAKGPAPSAS